MTNSNEIDAMLAFLGPAASLQAAASQVSAAPVKRLLDQGAAAHGKRSKTRPTESARKQACEEYLSASEKHDQANAALVAASAALERAIDAFAKARDDKDAAEAAHGEAQAALDQASAARDAVEARQRALW